MRAGNWPGGQSQRNFIGTAAQLAAQNPVLEAGQMAHASDTRLVYRGPGAVNSLLPDDISPYIDLSTVPGGGIHYRLPYPYLSVGATSVSVTGQVERWFPFKWNFNKPATTAAVQVTVLAADSSIVIGIYDMVHQTGAIGARLHRSVLSGAATGLITSALSVSLVPGKWYWCCIYTDTTLALFGTATPTVAENILSFGAAQCIHSLSRPSVTLANAAATSPPSYTGLSVSGGNFALPVFRGA